MSAAGDGTLSQILRAAIDWPPPADGQVQVVPPPPGPSDAVVAFTAHHVVAAPVDERAVMAQLPPEPDLSGPMRAPFLTWLGQQLGAAPGGVDLVVVAPPERPNRRSSSGAGWRRHSETRVGKLRDHTRLRSGAVRPR